MGDWWKEDPAWLNEVIKDVDFNGVIDKKDYDWWFIQRYSEPKPVRSANLDGWKDEYEEEAEEYHLNLDDFDDEDEFAEALEERREYRAEMEERLSQEYVGGYEVDDYDEDMDDYDDFDDYDDDIDPDDYDDEGDYLDALEEKRERIANKRQAHKRQTRNRQMHKKVVTQTNSRSVNESATIQKNQKPMDNAWRYYDECGYWEFIGALLENFPELKEDYEGARCDLVTIIKETYEIDKPRAIKYLKWLWKTFPADLLKKGKNSEANEYCLYQCRGEPVYELIIGFSNDDYLYKELKNDTDFLFAAFRDCVHHKHNYYLLEYYMNIMLRHQDVNMALIVYACYLHWQKGRYSANDLDKLWTDLVRGICRYDLSAEEKIVITERFIPFIKKLGDRAKKPLKEIEENQEGWQERIDYEIAEKEEEERKKYSGKYAWRNRVYQNQRKYVDPDKYETLEEYRKALNEAYAKKQSDRVQERRALYTEKMFVIFVRLIYCRKLAIICIIICAMV